MHHRWIALDGRMRFEEGKRLKELDNEHYRLPQIAADQTLDILISMRLPHSDHKI